MRLVSARDLRKTYGRGRAARRVLDGASFDAHAGELVAIVGRSGSGKSTLLHLVGGLDRPDSGLIEVAGQRLNGSERALTAHRRERVGFVFQFFHLVPELSGAENVMLPARLPGAPPAARRRARRLVERLALSDVADSRPHQLSGGEQQRFAIARALVNDPPVLLADEPTGNLDQHSSTDVLMLLRQIAGPGRTVLLVTHDREATAIADRVLVLEDGKLRT